MYEVLYQKPEGILSKPTIMGKQMPAKKRGDNNEVAEIKADQVECSRCKTWYSTQTLGIDHCSNSKIRQSYIACRKCVLALRDENSTLKKRVSELEEIINKANQAEIANLPGPSTANKAELKAEIDEVGVDKAGTSEHANKDETSQKPKQPSNPKSRDIDIERKTAYNQRESQNRIVKPPIVMVGDSIIGSLRGKVSVNEAGSKIVCLSGADIVKIRGEARKKSESANGGLLILQGGGNGFWIWIWGVGTEKRRHFTVRPLQRPSATHRIFVC